MYYVVLCFLKEIARFSGDVAYLKLILCFVFFDFPCIFIFKLYGS